jgi:hypothetical protein
MVSTKQSAYSTIPEMFTDLLYWPGTNASRANELRLARFSHEIGDKPPCQNNPRLLLEVARLIKNLRV